MLSFSEDNDGPDLSIGNDFADIDLPDMPDSVLAEIQHVAARPGDPPATQDKPSAPTPPVSESAQAKPSVQGSKDAKPKDPKGIDSDKSPFSFTKPASQTKDKAPAPAALEGQDKKDDASAVENKPEPVHKVLSTWKVEDLADDERLNTLPEGPERDAVKAVQTLLKPYFDQFAEVGNLRASNRAIETELKAQRAAWDERIKGFEKDPAKAAQISSEAIETAYAEARGAKAQLVQAQRDLQDAYNREYTTHFAAFRKANADWAPNHAAAANFQTLVASPGWLDKMPGDSIADKLSAGWQSVRGAPPAKDPATVQNNKALASTRPASPLPNAKAGVVTSRPRTMNDVLAMMGDPPDELRNIGLGRSSKSPI